MMKSIASAFLAVVCGVMVVGAQSEKHISIEDLRKLHLPDVVLESVFARS